jgi:RNA polymerase sigma factor (sigma-70 family)
MRDPEIVALLADGDPRGLEAAYVAYADRIHDYARGMLRNASPDAAADVTHDTFLIALAKASGLRDRERFRAWLYAIARNECLRVLRTSKRTTALPTDDHTTADGSPDMSSGLAATERRALVLAAAEGLSPKDREVFELGMRHDLSAREVAAALGVSDNAAHAMLSRVRAQFERSLGALLVARQGRAACADLNAMLAGWDGSFDALWRKRIARHVTSCATCTQVERRELSPAALLAVMPLLPAPVLVRSRLFEDDTELVAYSRGLADRAGPWDLDGFPAPVEAGRRRPALLAVLAVVLLLFGVAQSVRLLAVEDPDEESAPTVVSRGTTPASLASYAFGGQVTLRARPSTPSPTTALTSSAQPSTAASATLSVTPSSAAPTGTASTPTRQPTTRTPRPTSSTPAPGTLAVSPTSLALRRGGSGTVVLTARGGPVSWSAVASEYLILSATSGQLAPGETVAVTVTLDRATPVTSQVVRFNGVAVTVRVCTGSTAC